MRVLRHEQKRLSPPEVEALIAEYEARARVCDPAKKFGLHWVTVAGYVARAGKTRPVITEAQIDTAVELYGLWWTLRGIAEHLGVDDRTVRRVLVGRAW